MAVSDICCKFAIYLFIDEYDDLTSGFNIGTNYSLSPEFNEMMGFTEKEVRDQMYTYLIDTYRENDLDYDS